VEGFRPLGVLADFVEVDPAFEKCVEEFLHEELEYVVVQDWSNADCGVDFLRRDLEGRATFLVHPEPETNGKMRLPEPTIGPETGIIARLTDALKLTNGLKDRAADLLPRVSLCFVAEDRESARRLAVAYPHLYFLLQDGLCYHGQTLTGGKKTASGPLALKREAREVGLTLSAKMMELEEASSRAEALAREIAALESELERLRGSQQAREKDRLALEHEMRKVAEDTNRANSRLSVARLELERLRADREKSASQRVESQSALEEREALRASKEEALELERVELESLEAGAVALAEEHAVLRAELAGLEERSRGERAALGRLEVQERETAGRRAQIAPEVSRLGEERARLLGDNIELDRRGAEIAAALGEGEAEVNRLAIAEAEMREALRVGEEELRAMRVAVAEASERRAAIEVELVKRQAELGYLDETSRKELGLPVAELASGVETLPDAEALGETERLYMEVKNRIEALGPVNADALQEYQETQQRHDFLSVQRQDLLDSIRDTEKAIQDIDVVSREKFAEAFEAINTNFREGFTTLFGGGTGEMRLTDESNIAESGIDIVASPPGKKLQNVLLLSGGEKALAAVALLMAIFKYQPSPFCILDEVDAPLDEANIDRLTRLLRDMSGTTQFIVITHSKKTMESAGALYGVTMQEPGVSKLVSVRLNGSAVAEARV
jgi:chromosome segregation protein